MTTDRSGAWKEKFRRHFANNVARLGGDISNERRLAARQAAILQTELDYIAQRLAAGDGGTREDLNLFVSISATVKNLFESVAVTPAIDHKAAAERDRAALLAVFEKYIDTRQEEEGSVIIDARSNRDEPCRLQQPDVAPTSPATVEQPIEKEAAAAPGANSTTAYFEWIENAGGGFRTPRERF
jgi:hypothetical protein